MASIYDAKIWNRKTKSWEDNPDYVEIAREQTVGTTRCTLTYDKFRRKWRVQCFKTNPDGSETRIHDFYSSSPEEAIQDFEGMIANYENAQNQEESSEEPEFVQTEVSTEVAGITNQEFRESMPDTPEAQAYADAFPDGFSGSLILLKHVNSNLWEVVVYNTDPNTGNRLGLKWGKTFTSEEVATQNYTEQIQFAEDDRQATLDRMILGQTTHQAEQDRLRDDALRLERHTTVELSEEIRDIDKTTKELKSSMEGLNIFEVSGDTGWTHDGQVLALEDVDSSDAPSGAAKIVFQAGYHFDVRIAFEGSEFPDLIEAQAFDEEVWKLETNSQKMRDSIYGPDAGFSTALDMLDGVLSFQVTNGGSLQIDVDKEADNGIHGFYLTYNGQTLRSEQKIDDEVYINISYPKEVIVTEKTVVRDGLGNIVSEQDRVIPKPVYDPEPEPEDESGGDEEGSSIGWWILGGIILIGAGWFLWRMSRRNAQNRQIATSAQPAVAQNPAPVVVNVEASS